MESLEQQVYYISLSELRKVDKYYSISFSTVTFKYPVNNEEDLKGIEIYIPKIQSVKNDKASKAKIIN
jgi:hypothetical protein